jgi:ribosomal protein L37AE/L43A
MNENDVKKCKKCGATLVGKKSRKLGLCSNCARDLGQKGAAGATVFALVCTVGAKVIKIIRKP